jgi:hypothetical protein
MLNTILNIIVRLLFGFPRGRPRRRPGLSILLLLAGLCCGLSACATLALGVPASWQRLWEVRGMQRPQPAALDALAPGASVLIEGRLQAVAEEAPYGLTLFYRERQQTSTSSTGTTTSGSWDVDQPPPSRARITLADSQTAVLDLTPDTEFLSARIVDAEPQSGKSSVYRYTGYARDTLLTAEGVWRGEGHMSVRALYAGSVDDYLGYRSSMPWIGMGAGLLCCFVALGLVAGGGVLGLFGR